MSRDRTRPRLTRREFTGVVCAATTLPARGAVQTGVPSQPDYVPPPRPLVADDPPFAGPLEFTRTLVAAKVEPFPLTSVRLLPNSVFHDAQEWNRGYMARLAADRLLYTFRANAGLPVGSARPLGGWEQPENGRRSSELRGHFGGHFLSASALLYASTGDEEAKSKGDYLVAELARCQERLGGKYLGAFPTTWWDRLEKGQRVWAPFYTIHKVMAGMLDMCRLAGNTQALRVLEGMAAWADEWTASKSVDHMQQILGVEFGGMAETLYSLAAYVEQHGSPLAPTNRTPAIPDIEIPTFRAAGPHPSEWIKPADTPQEFRTTRQSHHVRLLPLHKLFDRRYAVYWQVS
jgi:uncharacterized protein